MCLQFSITPRASEAWLVSHATGMSCQCTTWRFFHFCWAVIAPQMSCKVRVQQAFKEGHFWIHLLCCCTSHHSWWCDPNLLLNPARCLPNGVKGKCCFASFLVKVILKTLRSLRGHVEFCTKCHPTMNWASNHVGFTIIRMYLQLKH